MKSELNIINLLDKVCVVTGAGKGIGYNAAKLFHRFGCKVAVITRSSEDLSCLEKDLNVDKNRFYPYVGDVSCPDDVEDFVANTISRFSKIDILINNAGIRFRKSFVDIDYEDWQEVMNVNVGSVFLMSQCVGRHMIRQNYGRIINMSSIVGTLGLPELCGYAASKGAIVSLTKSLALEWAKYNINVNVIAPGFCKTSYADKFAKNKELFDFTIERTPMKKWGRSSDISKACVFLASDMSSYVTGEILTVDGGWSAW